LLRQKLLDGVQQPLPRLTRRDTWIPRIPGKTLAVIGMRRSGKTSLLLQELGERVISLDQQQPTGEWPGTVIWSSALEWLLQA
jgi:hypothetical protein